MVAKVRVLVYSDEPIVRASLVALLDREPAIEVVGETSNREEVLRALPHSRPDVILLVSPPATPECLDITYRAIHADRRPGIVLLTRAKDPTRLLAFLHVGASGYVLLSGHPEYLREAILRAAQGKRFIDPSFSDNLADVVLASTEFIPSATTAKRLSERERLVLQHIAEGHTNRAIARLMQISVKTVETYNARLREKLGLTTKIDLVRYAVSIGLLETFGVSPDSEELKAHRRSQSQGKKSR